MSDGRVTDSKQVYAPQKLVESELFFATENSINAMGIAQGPANVN